MTSYKKDMLMWASNGFIGYVKWPVCLIWSQPMVLQSEGTAGRMAYACNSLQNEGVALDIEHVLNHGFNF